MPSELTAETATLNHVSDVHSDSVVLIVVIIDEIRESTKSMLKCGGKEGKSIDNAFYLRLSENW